MATTSDKLGWVATASSMFDTSVGGTGTGPERAIDGNHNGFWGETDVFFHTKGEDFEWMQIDFGQTKLVKAVHTYPRTDSFVEAEGSTQLTHIEIRIGDEDAASSIPAGQRICANVLCKTLFTHQFKPPSEFDGLDCASPLPGRYVTLQKSSTDIPEKAIVIAEIDVIFLTPYP